MTSLRTAAAVKFAPVDHAQLDAARSVLQQVDNAGSRVVSRYGLVLDQRNSPVVKAASNVKKLAEGR